MRVGNHDNNNDDNDIRGCITCALVENGIKKLSNLDRERECLDQTSLMSMELDEYVISVFDGSSA